MARFCGLLAACVLIGWLTKPGQALAVVALGVVLAALVAQLLAAHRRGLERLRRSR